jgi:tetratricopeptide (TPR) repeat protein
MLITAGIALSRCYRETGDLPLAIEVGDRLDPRIEEAGLARSDERVQLAVTVAGAHIMRGDLHKAARICAEAVRDADEISSPRARAGAYWNASIVHKRRGDVATAAPLAARALAILTEGSDARNLARLRAQLGELQLHMDPPELDEALANLTRARAEMHDSSASEVDVARLDVSIAASHLLAGDPELALSITADVRGRGLQGAALLHTEALVVEGQALTALGRAEEGHAAYVQAMHSLTAAGADRVVAQLWFELAELLERAGDLDGARQAYRSAAATTGLTTRQRSEKQVPSSL